MTHLYDMLAERTADWRKADYPCETYPLITDLLRYQAESDPEKLRFLRRPQLRALEAYWYCASSKTPPCVGLYKKNIQGKVTWSKRWGVQRGCESGFRTGGSVRAVRTDKDMSAATTRISSRNADSGNPSYHSRLAMGAARRFLIGAIIATGFAMATSILTARSCKCALFAPGKPIIESLRELSAMPYEKILPPRLYKPFAASVKLTFTRDGEKDIPVIRRSYFNVVVTNTEKIRVQKESIRKSDLGQMVMAYVEEEKAREEVANLRLQTLASRPHLAVFSDEAHHTYGQSLLGTWVRDAQTGERTFKELASKKVAVRRFPAARPTFCVVNRGTPYFDAAVKAVVVGTAFRRHSRRLFSRKLPEASTPIASPRQTDSFITEVLHRLFPEFTPGAMPSGASARLPYTFPDG